MIPETGIPIPIRKIGKKEGGKAVVVPPMVGRGIAFVPQSEFVHVRVAEQQQPDSEEKE